MGTQVELHYSVRGQPGTLAGNAVYQAGVQTTQGPVYLALAYLNAANATASNRVQEFMAGASITTGSFLTPGPGQSAFGVQVGIRHLF